MFYDSFFFAVFYIYCMKFPEDTFNVLLLVKMPAFYFVWLYLSLYIFDFNSFLDLLIGVVAGHCYLFFKEGLPLRLGINLLKTPKFAFPN